MKTTPLIIAFISVFLLSSVSLIKDLNPDLANEEILEAVFDGHEDYGYNFIVTNEDDEEHTVTFQKASEDVLSKYDLHSESLIGKKYQVTYTIETDLVKDENGYEDEVEILTITALEPM